MAWDPHYRGFLTAGSAAAWATYLRERAREAERIEDRIERGQALYLIALRSAALADVTPPRHEDRGSHGLWQILPPSPAQ